MRRKRIAQLTLGCLGLLSLIATAWAGEGSAQQPPKAQAHVDKAGTPVLGIVVGEQTRGEAVDILRVWPGSPAEQAGFMVGDRIVQIGDQKVNSPEAVRNAILQHQPGDRISVKIIRDDESKSLEVRLGGADGLFGWVRRGAVPETDDAPAWLGVQVAPGLSAEERGVVVTSVLTDSPAAAAGIKKDDAILRVDKTRVEAASDLQAAIALHRPGDTVRLVVRRDGKRRPIDVTLGSFAGWHGDIAQLSDADARELLAELLTNPLVAAGKQTADESESKEPLAEEVHLPKLGVAVLTPTKGSDVHGTIVLREQEDGLHLTGKVWGLQPGLHGFHIHEYGDLRDPQGKSAGGHFNPGNTAHGGPNDAVHHAGDLGNIEADSDGVAKVDILAPWLKLHFVIGRSIVVHGGEDDLVSQPSGDAGPRVALGVIGIAQPKPAKKASSDSASK